MGHKHTAEAKEKIRRSLLGRKVSEETRKKIQMAWTQERREAMSQAKKGQPNHPWTPESREKARQAKLGRKLSPEHKAKLGRKLEEHHAWKGNDVGYGALHAWVVKQLGKPEHCEKCGKDEPGSYEWANRSGEYKRDVSDWMRLCVRCHRNMDDVVNKSWVTRKANQ